MTYGQFELLTTDQLEKLLEAASEAASAAMREMLLQIKVLKPQGRRQVRRFMNTTLTTASGFLSETPAFKAWALENPTECQMAMARGALAWNAQKLLEELDGTQLISDAAKRALDAHKCVQTCRIELQAREGYQQGGWSAAICHRLVRPEQPKFRYTRLAS